LHREEHNTDTRANAQIDCLWHSSARLKLSASGIENGVDIDFQNRRRGLVAPFVGGHCMRTAKDKVNRRNVARRAAWAIGAVTRRIRRAKDGDGGRSKSDGQMQWAGVTTDDAGRIAEKSHELSEGPIVSDGVSLATRRFDRGGEVLFTRAIVQYATQS